MPGTERSKKHLLTSAQRSALADLVRDSAEIDLARRRLDRMVDERHRRYQRLYDMGIPVGTIAAEIGVTPWAVRRHLTTREREASATGS